VKKISGNNKREEGSPVNSKKVVKAMRRAQKLIQDYYYTLRKELMKRADTIRKWRESDQYDPVMDKWPDLVL